METNIHQKMEQISRSVTLKAVIVGILTLLLLIPSVMIQNLILERQNRSEETISRINAKWSNAQTINGPVLAIPYTVKKTDEKKNLFTEYHTLYLTPEQLSINVKLIPEERHYGIYKAILYKSDVHLSGKFAHIDSLPVNGEIKWKDAYVQLGITDLRGIENNVDFVMNNSHFSAKAGGKKDVIGEGLNISLKNNSSFTSEKEWNFSCNLQLKGSSDINFIPIGKNTNVEVSGNWKAPSFIGSFTPEYKLTESGFSANWNVLHFNRNIPEYWTDNTSSFTENSFGVDLVDTVDHYQLNMRSAKYALMFISLTFVVFFFVEVLTKKRIHPIQYFLVGIALILFYSLLLSFSEQIGFGFAYLIASAATIGLIVTYAHSIFKNKKQTGILALFLSILYIFLYVILQLEDIALLIGSVGLFVILGIIMMLTKKIKWYKEDEKNGDEIQLPKVNQSAKKEFDDLEI
ncbi:conserved membrane hypothetical protein [uncultured Paludibacter sp.]|nr:conserved membrane hypothetical protein [uncultured Paludibacter sp.]